MTSSVLFWNIWGHRDPEGVHNYLKTHLPSLDVGCLSEVTSMGRVYDPPPRVYTSTKESEPPASINGNEQLGDLFRDNFHLFYQTPERETWTCKKTAQTYEDVGFGCELLVRKGLYILETGSVYFFTHVPDVRPRVMEYVIYIKGGKRYLVAHLHGVWIPENTKGDHVLRDLQGEFVLQQLKRLARFSSADEVIFGGDLNLDLNTRAIAQLEEGIGLKRGFRNLIREFGITNTRTQAYRKIDKENEPRYADYVFVTQGVEIHDFVVDTSVTSSDHAPLRISFS